MMEGANGIGGAATLVNLLGWPFARFYGMAFEKLNGQKRYLSKGLNILQIKFQIL